ncbi:MAG TPA: tRNA lysidine(34) synthetase TilS [Clostridia bacterium]|nr:tRNA lysidine(34) synthetase TilS [Clostridia bacterium]
MNITNQVLAAIQKNKMVNSGDKIIAAVSGGPDSVALLDILVGLSEYLGITVYVAHLNHMFRGREAEEDAVFVEKLARGYGLEAIIEKRNVPAYIRETRLSAQEAARRVRFKFFDEIAKRLGAGRIALGHHADDQAETVLINFLRGAGTSGLKGMLPIRDDCYIRPLLCLSRRDILGYCKQHGLQYRTDSSNLEPVYARNRIRLQLLPLLKADYNRNIVCNLNRLSIICRDEDSFIEGQALQVLERIKTCSGDGVFGLNIGKMLKIPVALQRRIIRIAYHRMNSPANELSFMHVEKILAMAKRKVARGTIELPGGVKALKNYGSLNFVCCNAYKTKDAPVYHYRLEVPGSTYIPELDLTVLLEEKAIERVTQRPDMLPANEVLLDHDKAGSTLFVRPRIPGDVFNPFGMRGMVKLKKFLINNKIPAAERDRIPIFTNGDDIVWVGNIRPADKYRISGNTKNTLHIKLLPGKFK